MFALSAQNFRKKQTAPHVHVGRSESLNLVIRGAFGRRPFSNRLREWKVIVPTDFSVIRNPEGFIDTVTEIACMAEAEKAQTLYIDHSGVKSIDLAAEVVLDRVVEDLISDFGRRHKPLLTRGKLPDDKNIQTYLRAIGLIDALKIKSHLLSDEELAGLKVFSRQSKAAARLNRIDVTDFKEAVLLRLVDYLEKCLAAHNRALNAKAKAELIEYAGEILGNAEDHSGMDDWTVVGYLDTTNEVHWCDLAIFNYGTTIAQSFEALPPDSFARKSIEPYVEGHASRGVIRMGRSRSDLITVAALQGNISSKNRTEADTRGRGSVDLIEFFQRMVDSFEINGGAHPEMAILSGSTHIYFDGTYRMKADAQTGRSIIAFNAENDLMIPPDSLHVRDLGRRRFNGCIIGIRFPITDAQLVEVNNG